MSREIKFRAWDKFSKRMHSNVQSGVYEDPDDWTEFNTVLGLECFEVMQYTGLKDKDGKEIYEGDIVQFKSIRDIIERYEVEYTNYGEWAIGMHRLSMRFRSCEVIGNVHEHSHLLEETA